jgi:hypothetical protein
MTARVFHNIILGLVPSFYKPFEFLRKMGFGGLGS